MPASRCEGRGSMRSRHLRMGFVRLGFRQSLLRVADSQVEDRPAVGVSPGCVAPGLTERLPECRWHDASLHRECAGAEAGCAPGFD